MSDPTNQNNQLEYIKDRRGIYGLGFSSNEHLDLMNLVVLAYSGIIIKLFFQDNYTKLGNAGPASTTIWGYGLTALSLFLMIFMSMYLSKPKSKNSSSTDKTNEVIENYTNIITYYISLIFNNTLPILLTLGIVIYIIVLNYIYFTRINSNRVSKSYHTYSFFSSLLLIIQISLIVKYMFNMLSTLTSNNKGNKHDILIKSASSVLIVFNFLFVMIIHILLAFFSTDG
jgi:hypothetical protein